MNFIVEEVIVFLKDFILMWFLNIVYKKGNFLEIYLIFKLSEIRNVYFIKVGII